MPRRPARWWLGLSLRKLEAAEAGQAGTDNAHWTQLRLARVCPPDEQICARVCQLTQPAEDRLRLRACFGAPRAEVAPDIKAPGYARAKALELSLDQVFRETPRRADSQRRDASGFSFDQFFSEGQSEQPPAAPAQPPAQGSGPGEGGENDEQFNAWLEGLKQK